MLIAFFVQTMEELRQCLLYTSLELEQTRGAAQEELRKKDDQLVNLKDLLNKTIRERDEAQEKYQRLFLENLIFQQQTATAAPLSGISSIENNNNALSLSSSDCEESIVSSPVTIQPPLPSEYSMNIELTPDKPLPEKGKLLQAVMKAGPLLQTLLLAGPLPQWRHPPPPLESFQIPPVAIPQPPPPPPQFLHQQDSIFGNPNNICTSNTTSQCGRVSKKRNFSDGSDSSPTQNNKYQRVVLH